MATTPETVHCEVCNISLYIKNASSHFTGKKHTTKQNQHNRLLNSVFVSGVENVPRTAMFQLFNRFGSVEEISDYEGKQFCFVKYSNKEAPKKALKTRVFYKGCRLFIRNVKPQINDQNVGSRRVYQGQEDLDIEISTINVESNGVKSVFDLQVEELISRIQLGEDEYKKHLEICNDLEATFKFLDATAIVFGSCGNSLALKNSDIDIYLDCTRGHEETFVNKDCKVMYRSKLYSHIIRIGKARVPIVRFIHTKTGIRCDVTVKNKLGVMNSRLIRFLLSLDRRIRPFIMLLKCWAKEHSITANSQLSSYALIMMAVFYLQQLEPPLLPPISELITSDEIQGGWHCGFNENPWAVSLKQNNICVKEIAKGFFEFYANFDYSKYVICPLLGQPVLVDDFVTPEKLPDVMEAYKIYIRENQDFPFKVSFPLRIQDPFELNYNLGRGFTDKLLKMLCDMCLNSYHVFDENKNENELLNTLLVVTKKPSHLINRSEKIFYIPWTIQGCGEFGLRKQPPKITSETVSEWYILVRKAIFIVFTNVLKLKLEERDSNMSNKIKKSNKQDDVHTAHKSVFNCKGNTLIHVKRQKVRRNIEAYKLDEFERDVFVSNSRPCDTKNSVSFVASIFLHIPSQNEIPYVQIILQDSNLDKGNFFPQLTEWLQSQLESFVQNAITHICIKRKTSTFIELTDLNCDYIEGEAVDKSTQTNHETGVDERVSCDETIKPDIITEAEMITEVVDYSVDPDNPFLAAIERHSSNDGSETSLSIADNNKSDNWSQTLWNENNNESYNNTVTDFGNQLHENKTNFIKTDDWKTDNSRRVNDGRTNNNNKKLDDEDTTSKVVKSKHFVSKMSRTVVVQKEKNKISHTVQEVQGMVTVNSNGQINELKSIGITSPSTTDISVSHHKFKKHNKLFTGNVNKTSNNQTKVNHTISMKAERKLSEINLEVKPPIKNTVTVEDIKLYVKERFKCENIDENFVLALTKISNDIKNNSNRT